MIGKRPTKRSFKAFLFSKGLRALARLLVKERCHERARSSTSRRSVPAGPAERAAARAIHSKERKTVRHTVAERSPLPALGRRTRGGQRPTRRIARESASEGHAMRETTSRPAPRPPAQTTRTPLAPSRTYCGVVPGVAAAYRRPATSLRTTRPTAARPQSGSTQSTRRPTDRLAVRCVRPCRRTPD